MGGAFVAVGNDSSATWWNPGALAAGPFLDIALTRSVTSISHELPAGRDRVTAFALGTPVVGVSYYRLRITDIAPSGSTGAGAGDRQDTRAGVFIRSLAASQLGITLVQSLFPGIHAGTTLKYVRGRLVSGSGDQVQSASDLLQQGEDLEGGSGSGRFDLDVGVLAAGGPLRVGVVARNLRESSFGDAAGAEVRLPRQVRVGAAFVGGEDIGVEIPLTVSLDADVRRYDTATGERRVIAIGAEHWLLARRIGIRGGARFNTVGAEERAGTAGVSIAVRSGLYLDAHVVHGGAADERGWGAAARVSF
jgi:hypothetical protein